MVNNAEPWWHRKTRLPPMARAWLLLVLLPVGLPVPFGAGLHQGPGDTNAVDLNVLVWHPFPDEQGDPWGIGVVDVNGSRFDWMAGYHGAFFYPTAVFDGVLAFERPPTGEGGGAFQETYQNYRRAAEERRGQDSPATIRIEADLVGDLLAANVTFRADAALGGGGLFVRIVLYEDDVSFNGGNGIVNHRFVVREQRRHDGVDFSRGDVRFVEAFQLGSGLARDRLGLVAVLQNDNEDSPVFQDKEVLQAATWTVRQEGITVQESRGVLLELYSATWCEACVYGDSAADTLANEMGIMSSRNVGSAFEYLRPVPVVSVVAAVAVGAAFAFFVSRRLGGAPPAG